MLAIQALINLYPGNCFQMPRKYIDFGYLKSILQNLRRIGYPNIQNFREICCWFSTVWQLRSSEFLQNWVMRQPVRN